MGCGNCGSGGCSTAGCGNGGCSSGGCNRLNTHNWISDIPKLEFSEQNALLEVSFNRGSRKAFYRNVTGQYFEKGDMVAVESSVGYDVGTVTLSGELVKLQMAKKGVKPNTELQKVIRKANEEDQLILHKNKSREKNMLVRARAIARELKLEMKITEVELQADAKKAIFYYIAEDRVDFRELIKHYAYDFNVKVEMMQIGIRQEAAKVGGIGSCGRELCCSTWLSDFKTVGTLAARYQNLSINQLKLSGQCGRLKCCLNYELDTYVDLLKSFPTDADKLQVSSGQLYLQKKDIFKNLMWYTMKDSSKLFPLSIERAEEIRDLNKKGIQPEEIGAEELEKISKSEPAEQFVDVVGAFSLNTLDKKAKQQKAAKRKERKENNSNASTSSNPGNKPNQSQSQPSQKTSNEARTNAPQQKQQGNQPPKDNKPQGETQAQPNSVNQSGNVPTSNQNGDRPKKKNKNKYRGPKREN